MKFQARIEEYWADEYKKFMWSWYVVTEEGVRNAASGSERTLEEAKAAVEEVARRMKEESRPSVLEWKFEL